MRPRLLLALLAAACAEGVCDAQVLPPFWDRDIDWVSPPDTAEGTTQGNPAPDGEGNLVWHYDYVTTGGRLGSPNPWYDEAATPLVWDKSWFGQEGVWAVSDNFGTVIRPRGFTHVGPTSLYRPIVRWKNVTSKPAHVALAGSLRIFWSGDGGKASIVDVDLVIAHRAAATGTTTLLFSGSFPKPTSDTSQEFLLLPVDVGVTTIAPGDELLLSTHAYDSNISGTWVSITDNHLTLVSEPIGTSYCGPAVANSAGVPGLIVASGSKAVVRNDLTLKALQLPENQFGMFLASMTAGFVSHPGGSQGNLCLGGEIGRFRGPGQVFDTQSYGAASLAVDLGALPTPSGPVAALPGDTWYFQCWYRDVAAKSNFTDGVAITFQ